MEKTAMVFKVYFLPHENYCGVTGRCINKRLYEHKRVYNRNIDDFSIIGTFKNKKDALYFEKEFQLKNGTKGYGYNSKWRKEQSQKLLLYGEEKIYSKNRKKIICIDTGIIYKGVRVCERELNLSTGNLSKHLKGDKFHQTINNCKFKYHV